MGWSRYNKFNPEPPNEQSLTGGDIYMYLYIQKESFSYSGRGDGMK